MRALGGDELVEDVLPFFRFLLFTGQLNGRCASRWQGGQKAGVRRRQLS